MRFILLAAFAIIINGVKAQYSTPDTGVNWNLDSLIANSNGAVAYTNDGLTNYCTVHESITVSLSDSLIIIDSVLFQVKPSALFTVEGYWMTASDQFGDVGFVPVDNLSFQGFRFENESEGHFNSSYINKSGGMKVLTGNFSMENCHMDSTKSINTSGAAIEISTGKPQFIGNIISNSEKAAISSAANAEVAPFISNNTFLDNNTANENRPQINLGPSGDADTTKIMNNLIIGHPENDQAGGIGFSSLLGLNANVLISENTVENNRYGIAVIGSGISAIIVGNTLANNNTQGNPNLGGSGINLNASSQSQAILAENILTGNLWGVTIQGGFEVDLGSSTPESPGLNQFYGNGNNGQIYALYNNTQLLVEAQNNCWDTSKVMTLEEVENVISHQTDDPSLGFVNYQPVFQCYNPVGLSDTQLQTQIEVYPNPARDFLDVTWNANTVPHTMMILNAMGQVVLEIPNVINPRKRIAINTLSNGIYILALQFDEGYVSTQFVVD